MNSLEKGSFEIGALDSKKQSTPKKVSDSTTGNQEAETTNVSSEAEVPTREVSHLKDSITEEELFQQQVGLLT